MRKEIKDGGPAFPFGQISEATGQPVNGFYDPGMSLRDFFAAKAMQGYFSAPHTPHRVDADDVAQYCYEIADAMLAAREVEP